MPLITYDLSEGGLPIIDVWVRMTEADLIVRQDEGGSQPPAIPLRALVDTGAGMSHVRLSLLEEFGITVIDFLPIDSSAKSGPPEVRDIYLVDIAIADAWGAKLAEELRVVGNPVLNDNDIYGMILGRDVLSRCLLTYVGFHERFVISYNDARPAP